MTDFAFGGIGEEEDAPALPFPTRKNDARDGTTSIKNDFLTTNGNGSRQLARSRVKLSPSELLTETGSLPLDAFADEYQPTPTVVQPTNPSPSPRSSEDRLVVGSSTAESDTETEEDNHVMQEEAKATNVPTEPRKKHVAFENAIETSSGSTSADQDSSSTPVASLLSTGESHSSAPIRLSQTTTDCELFHLSYLELAGCSLTRSSVLADSTTMNEPLTVFPSTLPPSRFPLSRNCFVSGSKPPTTAQLYDSLAEIGSNDVVYKDPYYSKPADVPRGPREFAGKTFTIEGDSIKYSKPFLHHGTDPALALARQNETGPPRNLGVTKWEYSGRPPSKKEALEWMIKEGNRLLSMTATRDQSGLMRGPLF
jgi:DNA polymerase zeta